MSLSKSVFSSSQCILVHWKLPILAFFCLYLSMSFCLSVFLSFYVSSVLIIQRNGGSDQKQKGIMQRIDGKH